MLRRGKRGYPQLPKLWDGPIPRLRDTAKRAKVLCRDDVLRLSVLRVCKRHGIEPETYLEMYDRQGGACAICKAQKPLCIDHCHDSKRVRGLLCSACNSALGLLGDDPSRIRSAAAYLDDWR